MSLTQNEPTPPWAVLEHIDGRLTLIVPPAESSRDRIVDVATGPPGYEVVQCSVRIPSGASGEVELPPSVIVAPLFKVRIRNAPLSMERIEDGYVLSTGREIDAHLGIIGIVKDEDGWKVHGGYDDTFPEAQIPKHESVDDPMTAAERRELADFMIAQWQAYRDEAS